MQTFKTGIILALIFSIQMLGGCTPGQSDGNTPAANAPVSNSSNSNTAKDDVEELGVIVNLPFLPIEATWKEEPFSKQGTDHVPTQNEKKLTAVLRFSPEHSKAMLAELEKKPPAEPVSLSVEQWFPAELTAQSEISGDDTLNGNSYPAEGFLIPPYTDGKIVKIENSDYFVLEIFSK